MTEQDGVQASTTRRVIAGVDGSADSERAVRWAAREALDLGLPLTLVHAVHLPDSSAAPYEPDDFEPRIRAEGAALLDGTAQAVKAEFPELQVDTVLSEQSAAHALSELSHESDVIVTGTRGHGGFVGMLLGSVSRTLAAHAQSPLVVVRGDAPGSEREDVVLGVELGEDESVIRYAFAAAQRGNSTLRVVHAWWPTIYASPVGAFGADISDTFEAERKAIDELLAPGRAAFPDVTVEVTVNRGNPVPSLIEAATGARLLVVGAHHHHGPLAVGAGYVVEGLLSHSPTPVAVVPLG